MAGWLWWNMRAVPFSSKDTECLAVWEKPGCSQTPALSGWKADAACCCMCVVSVMHPCVHVHVCLRCFHRDRFQMLENVSWKVFCIIFRETGTFCALKFIALSIQNSLGCETLGKHCTSARSQPPIHGQWGSSKLYISMSSQIRVSVLWFSRS